MEQPRHVHVAVVHQPEGVSRTGGERASVYEKTSRRELVRNGENAAHLAVFLKGERILCRRRPSYLLQTCHRTRTGERNRTCICNSTKVCNTGEIDFTLVVSSPERGTRDAVGVGRL